MKQRVCGWLLLAVCLLMMGSLPVSAAGKVTDVHIAAEPAKLSYTEGERFDPTGMVIIITYEDGTTAPAEISDYNYSPAGPLSTVHRSVVIDCAGKKLTLPITVVAAGGTAATSAGEEIPTPTTTPAPIASDSPEEGRESPQKAPRTDRQGQDWNALHWTAAILTIAIVAAILVVYYHRYLAGRR